VPRALQNSNLPNVMSRQPNFNGLNVCPRKPGGALHAGSRITALSIEFVAKPHEAQKVQAALPAALNGALGEVAGFAGSFVMIANHEERLVTVVTLWSGEDRLQRCTENVRWVRALLAPYLDRCLRVLTLAAYVPEAPQVSQQFEQTFLETGLEARPDTEEAMCVA